MDCSFHAKMGGHCFVLAVLIYIEQQIQERVDIDLVEEAALIFNGFVSN